MCLLWRRGLGDSGTQPMLSWSWLAVILSSDYFGGVSVFWEFFFVWISHSQACSLNAQDLRTGGTSGFNLRNPMNKLWTGDSANELRLLCDRAPPPQNFLKVHCVYSFILREKITPHPQTDITFSCLSCFHLSQVWPGGVVWHVLHVRVMRKNKSRKDVCKSIFQNVLKKPA